MISNQWTAEHIFFSGDEYYRFLEKDIQNARSTIEMECYIFSFDEIGKKIAQLLIQAATRGVRVRVIVDGVGSAYAISDLQSIFQEGQVEFKVFHPLFSSWFVPVFKTMNRRNHRKTWIFDHSVAYVGSFNISEVHSTLVNEPWRDSGLRVEGEEIKILSQAFEKIWSRTKNWRKRLFYSEDIYENELIRLNDGKNKRRAYYRDLLFRIREAKEHICFGNAYFAPHFRLVAELCYSARRGVKVDLIVPKKSDVFFMPWVGSSYYYALLRSGVKIYEYTPAVFHAKNYMIDDWMLVGSSNLNHRSLFHDLEADIRVTQEENKKIFLEEISRDIKNSELVTFQSFRKISWIRNTLTQFFLLFKSWL